MEPPSCSEGEFQCSYAAAHRKCIRIKFRCDGDNDCGDWSDEVGCAEKPRECGAGEFKYVYTYELKARMKIKFKNP